MSSLAYIRCRSLGLLAALLMLAHSLFAVALPTPYAGMPENTDSAAEVKQEISFHQHSYFKISTQITLATFLFYWVARIFAMVDAPVIQFQNCKAFFVNPASYNSYYTYLSALAP